MQIKLVSRPDAIARWQELVDDPDLARLPYRIETDRFGRTIMKSGSAGAMERWNFTSRTWRRLRGSVLYFPANYERSNEAAP